MGIRAHFHQHGNNLRTAAHKRDKKGRVAVAGKRLVGVSCTPTTGYKGYSGMWWWWGVAGWYPFQKPKVD